MKTIQDALENLKEVTGDKISEYSKAAAELGFTKGQFYTPYNNTFYNYSLWVVVKMNISRYSSTSVSGNSSYDCNSKYQMRVSSVVRHHEVMDLWLINLEDNNELKISIPSAVEVREGQVLLICDRKNEAGGHVCSERYANVSTEMVFSGDGNSVFSNKAVKGMPIVSTLLGTIIAGSIPVVGQLFMLVCAISIKYQSKRNPIPNDKTLGYNGNKAFILSIIAALLPVLMLLVSFSFLSCWLTSVVLAVCVGIVSMRRLLKLKKFLLLHKDLLQMVVSMMTLSFSHNAEFMDYAKSVYADNKS